MSAGSEVDPSSGIAAVRVVLPGHLKVVAGVEGELILEVARPVTTDSVLDALERRFPTLRGTVREHGGGRRRPMVRIFACREDWTHRPADAPLPSEVAEGREPLFVVGAMAGG